MESRIDRCAGCGLEWQVTSEAFGLEQYRGNLYREQIGERADALHYFDRHDHEQFEKLLRVRGLLPRGGVVADVGCGGGSFLDFVKGVAGRTIAIEPAEAYHESLRSRGHDVFPTCDRVSGPLADLVTSFSVIEHVEHPVEFARSIRSLLKPGGWAVLSTPNRADVMLRDGPAEYKSFFYRQVHLFYFDASSLRETLSRAGYVDIRVEFMHRFGFGNYGGWMRDRRPPGDVAGPLEPPFDDIWRATLESQGVSDYLYVAARNPERASA